MSAYVSNLSVPLLLAWMVEAGLWLDRKQRRKAVHQPRYRRECVGELVQVDGCEHWWFEDRGPQCTLLRRRNGCCPYPGTTGWNHGMPP
jgi:hypothetical protein